jgi:hypothetical protein
MSIKFFIAGVQHRVGAAAVLSRLVEEDELELVPEPDNKFDPNAIRIEYEGNHVGYVPKKFSSQVSALIEAHGVEALLCVVTTINPSGKPCELCEVEIIQILNDDDDDIFPYDI